MTPATQEELHMEKDSRLNPVITFVLYSGEEEDAFDIAVLYTNATELIQAKENLRKGGKVDMCTAITKMIADGRDEGRREGISQGISQGIEENTRRIVFNMIKRNMSDEDICVIAECTQEFVDKLRQELKKSE